MTTRTSTNFWLDVVSLIVMIGLAATGGLIHFVLPAGSGHFYVLFGWNRHDLGQLHFYLAVSSVVLLVLHVLLHWNWICCVIAKGVGKDNPSQKSQTMGGISLLLVVALLLGGGLFGASTLVRQTRPEDGRPGRRSHLDATRRSQAALPSDHLMEAAASREQTSPVASPLETRPLTKRGDGEGHLVECPAGASIDGRTELLEAARLGRVSVAQLVKQLGLPLSTDPQEPLGQLKRHYGLDLDAVRRIACR